MRYWLKTATKINIKKHLLKKIWAIFFTLIDERFKFDSKSLKKMWTGKTAQKFLKCQTKLMGHVHYWLLNFDNRSKLTTHTVNKRKSKYNIKVNDTMQLSILVVCMTVVVWKITECTYPKHGVKVFKQMRFSVE